MNPNTFYQTLLTLSQDTCTRIADRPSAGFTQIVIYLNTDYGSRRNIASIEITDEMSLYNSYEEVIKEIVKRALTPEAIFLVCGSEIPNKGEYISIVGSTSDDQHNLCLIPIDRVDSLERKAREKGIMVLDPDRNVDHIKESKIKSAALETFWYLWMNRKR